jgi:hypothetical protein
MICGVSRPTSRATHHPPDPGGDAVDWGPGNDFLDPPTPHGRCQNRHHRQPDPRHVAAEGTKGLSRRLLTKEMPMSKREKTYHEDLGQPADPSNSFEKKQNERPVELSSERLGEDDNDPGALPIGTPGSSNATK